MRVALAIGRPDPLFDRQSVSLSAEAREAETIFWTSSILNTLREACAKRRWAHDILYIGKDGAQQVARPDVVVNLISEPLICENSLALLDRTAQDFGLKVLNTPDATRRTSRTSLPAMGNTRDGIIIPPTSWHQGPAETLGHHISTAGHRWPVLIRPPGSHGSMGLQKVDVSDTTLSGMRTSPGGYLVTDFHDFRSRDGLYRKYRIVRVDSKIFRRHLIISDDWNITGASRAFMVDKPHLIAEEKNFLADSGGDMERRIAALFTASGLDFGLIDFAWDGDGQIVVFELNGCFQITGSIPEDKLARWGYLEDSNNPILDAIMDLITASAQKAPAPM